MPARANAWMLLLISAAFFISLKTAPGTAQEQETDRPVTIGTAGPNGVYLPAGIALCNALTGAVPETGCTAVQTLGSRDNIAMLAAGELDAAIVQSDLLFAAIRQEGIYADRPELEGLRTVLTLHNEPLTVIARKDANVRTVDDLAGKRVNIGDPGTARREVWTLLSTLYDWSQDDFAAVTELAPAGMEEALCNNEIDAFFLVVGHPNALVQRTLSACDAELVPVSDFVLGAILNTYPYYSSEAIVPGIYNNTTRINTFGTTAMLVTTGDADPELISALVRAVLDGLPSLRREHPALARLRPKRLASGEDVAPFHPGAERVFQERGLISD